MKKMNKEHKIVFSETHENAINLPKYVIIEGIAFCYNKEKDEYLRDNGHYSINYIIDHDGKLIANCPHLPKFNGKEFKPTTYSLWHYNNYHYF